jgi:hypothetical protein
MKWRNRSHAKWRAKFWWHRWFAWRPVNVGRFCVWLAPVERRRVCAYDDFAWEYREIGA